MGMYISGRERKILFQLLTAEEEVTVKDLSESLQVSERTIHRDLKKIEHSIENYHLRLIKKAGQGVRIQGEIKNIQQLQSVITSEVATDFTPEERKTIILTMLLERNEPIKLFTLANELNVTSATVSNDLDLLVEELTPYQLSIVRKKGLGILIKGEEARKRSLLSYLISEHLNPVGLANQLKSQIQKQHVTNHISNRLFGYVNPEVLEIIEKQVDLVSQDLPYELADSGYIGLVVHLALAIERVKQGDIIQFDKDYLKDIITTNEYEIAQKLMNALEAHFMIDIPDDEIGYITMHLLGAKLQTSRNNLMEDTSLDVAVQANELIRNVSIQLNKDLSDNKLLHDLTIHLKPAIYRLKQGMTIRNPMLKAIKKDYLDFFQIVQKAADETFPDLIFPEDEIGYLVLHFAAAILQEKGRSKLNAIVICSSGIGTSRILASKLLHKIPELHSVENKSMFDLSDDITERYDLIISTIPLEGLEGNYILTSPMLTETEIAQIQKEIRKKALVPKTREHTKLGETNAFQELQSIQSYSNVILDVLDQFGIQQVSDDQSVKSVLDTICMKLVESKIITDKHEVLENLLKREKQGGIGIPNTNLSLHHTRNSHILVPIFRIYSLSSSKEIKGMDGEVMEIKRILLMLAPENVKSEVLEVFSLISTLVIQDQESVELFELGTENEIKQFLSNHFYQFMNEKITK